MLKLYHIIDDSKDDDITCASCLNSLDNEEFITALGQNYHIDCFRYDTHHKSH